MLINELTTFIQLVESLSFTKTAAKQNTTQATISRRIQELERNLGLQLVKRDTRNITITEAGQKLYAGVKKQENELDNLVQQLHHETRENEGTIKVSLAHVMAYKLISRNIGKFLRSNPGINLQIFYQNNSFNLVNEQFDLAVVAQIPKQQTTIVKLLCKFKLQLYCTPEYIHKYGQPQCIADLQHHLYTGFIQNDFTLLKQLHAKNIRTNEVTVIDNIFSRIMINSSLHAQELARAGELIVGAWDYIVQDELNSGAMVKILPEYTFGEVPYYLIRLPNSRNAINNLFAQFVENLFASIEIN